ncbi:hypothetical protein ACSLNU_19935, partial [Klebsiella variicola]
FDVFAGKKSAQIREILISESAWEEMTCLFAPSLACSTFIPNLSENHATLWVLLHSLAACVHALRRDDMKAQGTRHKAQGT